MDDDDARPPWAGIRVLRDAVLLLVVAAVLVGGLVHYASRMHRSEARADASAGASGGAGSAPTSSPTSTPAATDPPAAVLDSGPSADPDTAPPTVTCWDGRAVSSLPMCSLPTGTAGLRWVFPSLDGAACHPAPHPAGAYRTRVGLECFAHAAGQPVAITYEQVQSADAAERAVEAAYPGAREFRIPGAHGGRCTWFDPGSRPVRVTGLYERFPYVVSVYAPTRQAAKKAWATLVRQRAPRSIRGLPA